MRNYRIRLPGQPFTVERLRIIILSYSLARFPVVLYLLILFSSDVVIIRLLSVTFPNQTIRLTAVPFSPQAISSPASTILWNGRTPHSSFEILAVFLDLLPILLAQKEQGLPCSH